MIPRQFLVRVAGALGVTIVIFWLLLSSVPAASPPSWHGFGKSARARGLLNDIGNHTLGFQQVFVVGLPERTDRRDAVTLNTALSGITFQFINGVLGDSISDKALPKEFKHKKISPGALGCWRAHMNALQEIVRNNISTALILEDDADWDVRLRRQLHDLALSSQALTQPLAGQNSYADTSYQYRQPAKKSPDGIISLDFNNLPETSPVTFSPYGDEWDLLWLGHCGMQMPPADGSLPRGRVVSKDDETVPAKEYLLSYVKPYTLKDEYPDHTRVVHHAYEGICLLAYAVTQKGAQELLREIALKDPTTPVDILMRWFCNGERGRRHHNCLAIQPPIFNPHRTRGPKEDTSNIDSKWSGWWDTAETRMTRWSVRLNADKIIAGEKMEDQFPDK
ncbi:hypothetical protein BGZ61DRAFT_411456 [Ilyonectria robusta]|uniref:uncharacterized protein n=1 Tax=Ilyonectria robusta TaxID=1079257 RepID=UPI001E8E7FF5|nr:uncharacterized protein BGZ61DRAFT_411456 [Ilyonectria robusta]KAH8736639.1 hypothetical protein BGZ61DRAFT_411456 [Ilyonectria robusta]